MLYYKSKGRGRPLFIIHGGPGFDSSYFGSCLDSLASSWKLYYIDLRGGGQSPRFHSNEYTIGAMIQDIEKIRRFERLNKIYFLGHSFGGFLSLEYTLRYSKNVLGLILVSTAADNSCQELCKKNCQSFPDILAAIGKFEKSEKKDDDFKQMTIRCAPIYFYNPKRYHAVEVLSKIAFGADCFVQISQNYFSQYSVIDNIYSIKVPTLVIVGDSDLITPPILSQKMASLIPNAELIIFKKSGHFPFIENKKCFSVAVSRWLQTQSGRKEVN